MARTDGEEVWDLRVGTTTMGMVRLSVEREGREIALDFDPEETEAIAEELRAAAAMARAIAAGLRPGRRRR
jgi:hypothetical protein